MVLAWSTIPVGALLGGWAIHWLGSVALVYAVIGAIVTLVAAGFWFSSLGHVERYQAAATSLEADAVAPTSAAEATEPAR